MSRRSALVAMLMAALALLAAACGASDDDPADALADAGVDAEIDAGAGTTSAAPADDSAGDDPAPTSTTAAAAGQATTASEESEPEPEAEEPEPEEPAADVVITGSLTRGELMIEDRRFDVPIGSTVRIEFTADEAEHVHLHGYDILADVGPDLPVEMVFVADSPGTFEVELEDSGRFLFEILVR